MKRIIFSALAIIGMFSFISCERHTWEDSSEEAKDGTKRLYPKPEHGHATHGDDGHAAHGDTDQAKKKAHGDHSGHDHDSTEDHSGHGH